MTAMSWLMNRTAAREESLSLTEQGQHVALHDDVERCGWLVCDDQDRLGHESHAYRRTLPHAPGQLAGILAGAHARRRDADRLQSLNSAGHGLFARQSLVHFGHLG